MFVRSELSLSKDEFNFAWILAYEVKTLLDSENAVTPNQQLELACIYLKLLEVDIVDSDTIQKLSKILGIDNVTLIESQRAKARLETDFANSAG